MRQTACILFKYVKTAHQFAGQNQMDEKRPERAQDAANDDNPEKLLTSNVAVVPCAEQPQILRLIEDREARLHLAGQFLSPIEYMSAIGGSNRAIPQFAECLHLLLSGGPNLIESGDACGVTANLRRQPG